MNSMLDLVRRHKSGERVGITSVCSAHPLVLEAAMRLARQTGAGPTPPALLLVPAGREDLRREAQEAGARRTVDLPYDPVELLEALRELGGEE